MTDRSRLLDPLLVEGPRLPMETLRPAVSAQRVLLLDTVEPRMVDLATGDIRRWENGPPVSVPCVSGDVDLAKFGRLQFQVLRDPRPTSVDTVLLSAAVGAESFDVVETVDGQLQIVHAGVVLARGPIGGSPAVVIVLEPRQANENTMLSLSARNAETAAGIDTQARVESTTACVFTIGGPSTRLTGAHGRRRLIPIHLDVVGRSEPADIVRQVSRQTRRVAGIVKRRIQR